MKRIILLCLVLLVLSPFFTFGAPENPTAHKYLKTSDDDYIVTSDGDYIYLRDGKVAIQFILFN